MRLLDKKSIAVQAASQKKKQIDEGTGLATKVDALRRTLSDEERRLETFRSETIKQVHVEINLEQSKLDSVKKDVLREERKRAELQKPLDVEWEKIRQELNIIQRERIEQLRIQETQDQRDLEQEKQQKEIDNEKLRVTEDRRLSSKNLTESEELRKESQITLYDARTKAQETLSNVKAKERIVILREENIIAREEKLEQEKSDIQKKEIDLANRERALTDKYLTFIRTQQRIKNG